MKHPVCEDCAAMAIIVTVAGFIKYFWSTPSMPSTVLVDVIRTDDPIPRYRPSVLSETKLKKEKHREYDRKTAYRH